MADRLTQLRSRATCPTCAAHLPPAVSVLHDRLRPGTNANIDHLAVTPSGVWVIDAKRYRGQVVKNNVGGWFSPEIRLYVGRRDCTAMVRAMSAQVAAVREALGARWAAIPVHPVLCFVNAEWRMFAKPFDVRGVLVTWPKAMRDLLARPGSCPPGSIEIIAATLEGSLRSAS